MTTLFFLMSTAFTADYQPINCEGTYLNHLQGVCPQRQDGEATGRCQPLGKINEPKDTVDSWVYFSNFDDLSCVGRYKTLEVFHGAGGIALHEGKFLVAGGLIDAVTENHVAAYDSDYHFMKKHPLAGGHAHRGIQTAAFAEGHPEFVIEPSVVYGGAASLSGWSVEEVEGELIVWSPAGRRE